MRFEVVAAYAMGVALPILETLRCHGEHHRARPGQSNEVELAVDNFDETDSMNAWFARGGSDRNFVGVPFDPEQMLKQHREGVELGSFFAESYE